MSGNILDDRRRALEEAFFAKYNEELRRRLATGGLAPGKAAIAAATGITDDAVLDRLIGLDLGADTLAALSLAPLVAVAWADGTIEPEERAAILAAAAEAGLDQQAPSHALLEQWLHRQPPASLLAAWTSYTAAISATLSEEARRAFRSDMLGRARAVAVAAGGILGFGRISAAEDAVLKQLEAALS